MAIVWPHEAPPVTPMPRNARPASSATNAGSISETLMMIGAVRLGRSSLNRMRRVGMPSTRAAWMNSRSRRESTSPRIRRATVIQPNIDRIRTSEADFWIVS